MDWLTLAVQATFPWPAAPTEITYLGTTFLLTPETEQEAQSVSMKRPPEMTMDAAALQAKRFLSALSWSESGGITELFAIGNRGPAPATVGKSEVRTVAHKFRADFLPEPATKEASRALALYREASSQNSPTYAFLGFHKILNIVFAKGADQQAWVNSHLSLIRDSRAKKRADELASSELDVGKYLYVQGRCAVAHAYDDPVVDPDEPTDVGRIADDVPLIRELASLLMEAELGIQSAAQYYSSHLYELKGFAELLGQATVEALKSCMPVPEQTLHLPPLSLRIRGYAPWRSLERLDPTELHQSGGQILVHMKSADGILHVILILDFAQWRLVFDPFTQVGLSDNGSAAFMVGRSDLALFSKALVLNGEVEVYEADSNRLLARTDPYVPENVDVHRTVQNMDKISRQALAEAEGRGRAEV